MIWPRALDRNERWIVLMAREAKMNAWLKVALVSALVAMSFADLIKAHAQNLPPGVRVLTPSDLKWAESPRAPGVQSATLVGDPSKPGPYVLRAKYPPNLVNPPHHHPLDEELTVLSGTLYLGHGDKMDPAKAIALPPGSFMVEPGKTLHYLFTKTEPVEVEIRGMGPRANIFAK
jgi:quercetin dioxygenase-like cupin family protein